MSCRGSQFGVNLSEGTATSEFWATVSISLGIRRLKLFRRTCSNVPGYLAPDHTANHSRTFALRSGMDYVSMENKRHDFMCLARTRHPSPLYRGHLFQFGTYDMMVAGSPYLCWSVTCGVEARMPASYKHSAREQRGL